MATKQNKGLQAPDGSTYGTLTTGTGNLSTGSAKQSSGLYAPDGSQYLTLTDGNGTLT